MPAEKLSQAEVNGSEGLKTIERGDAAAPETWFPAEHKPSPSCTPVITVSPRSAGVRGRRNGRTKKRPLLRIGIRLVQIALSGVIGLAAGGFILFLVNPTHPLILSLSRALHGSPAVDGGVAQPQAPGEAPRQRKDRRPSTVGSRLARPTPAANDAGSIMLFNGKDLSGWTCDLDKPGVKMEDVWSVADGVLHCKGRPTGYLITKKKDYKNYQLDFDWRWPTGKGGNSGLLVHCSTPRAAGIWCKSVEVQLMAGDAGDFWAIGDIDLDVENEAQRHQERRYVNLTDGTEKPLGQWNHMEVVCRGEEITVTINGVLVNHATKASVTEGAIALQSEGVPIEFRDVKLTPLGKE